MTVKSLYVRGIQATNLTVSSPASPFLAGLNIANASSLARLSLFSAERGGGEQQQQAQPQSTQEPKSKGSGFAAWQVRRLLTGAL